MAKKRTVRKKKGFRPGRFLWLLLLAAVTVAVILILRPSADREEPVSQAGDALWNGSWYGDDLSRIQKDRALIRGMKTFEKKTGTRPYLKLLGDVDPEALDTFAREQYEALFSEGDHLLVVYDEWGEDAYCLAARTWPLSALTEAEVSLLLSCIETAYADPANGSYAEAFGAGFAEGGRQIYGSRERGNDSAELLLILAFLLIALGVVLILFLRKTARHTVE